MADAPEIPLTPAQQELVLRVIPLARSLAARTPVMLHQRFGLQAVEQEAYLAACRAARTFNESLGTWRLYARRGIRAHLYNLIARSLLHSPVWNEWPHSATGAPHPGPPSPPDIGTELRAWCDDGARAVRAHLPLRWRVILYLIAVEGWRGAEVADALGMSRQRLSGIRERAVESLLIGCRAKRRGKTGSKALSSLT